MPKVRSKREAGFWGAVAGGRITLKGVSKKEARNRLRGVRIKGLPTRVRRKKRRR